jgi:hypothetical protein
MWGFCPLHPPRVDPNTVAWQDNTPALRTYLIGAYFSLANMSRAG